MLSTYLSFANKGAGRSSYCDQPCTFQQYLRRENETDDALHMPDVLIQVFAVLDSLTLCTVVPVVCKLWHKTATDPQLWTPRLPQQVVAVAATHAAKTASSHSQSTNRRLPSILPLLHHAIYSKNFLRNPSFLQSQNSNFKRLIRMRPASWVTTPGSGDAASSSKSVQSIISSEQRRCAWVASRSTGPEAMRWQCSAADTYPPHPSPPAPAPYPSYSSSISQQLQGWLKGLTASAVSTAAAVAATRGALVNDQTQQQPQQQGVVSCLATGSGWGEVIQVVDLFQELAMRSLPPSLAAALLDTGELALGLSVWATAVAPTDNTDTHSDNSGSSSDSSSRSSSTLRHESHRQSQSAGSAAVGSAALHVALMLDDGQVPLKTFQTFVRRDSSHHFVSQRMNITPGGGWQRYCYLLPACPRGCRRAVVLLRGRGSGMQQQQLMQQQQRSSSSSSSGIKFASAELRFVSQHEAQSWQAGSSTLT